MPKKGKASKGARGGLGISSKAAVNLAHNQKRAGVPPFTYACLVFPFAFDSSSTTGSAWSWQWRLNSLYDPDFTGSGSQPTTWDQWMALYDRYRVIATEVDLTICSQNGTGGLISAFAPGTDAAPTLTFTGIAGMRDAVIAPQKVPGVTRMRRTYLMKDIFGIDEEAMMSEINYSGTSSTSAPAVAYGTVGVFTATSATEPIFCSGCLRFSVRFESPHSNNISLALAAPKAADAARTSTIEGVSVTFGSHSRAPNATEDCAHASLRKVFDPQKASGVYICTLCGCIP